MSINTSSLGILLMQTVVGSVVALLFAKPLDSPLRVDTGDLALSLVAFSLALSMYAYDLMQTGAVRNKFNLWDSYF
jgi:hypothetical protein